MTKSQSTNKNKLNRLYLLIALVISFLFIGSVIWSGMVGISYYLALLTSSLAIIIIIFGLFKSSSQNKLWYQVTTDLILGGQGFFLFTYYQNLNILIAFYFVLLLTQAAMIRKTWVYWSFYGYLLSLTILATFINSSFGQAEIMPILIISVFGIVIKYITKEEQKIYQEIAIKYGELRIKLAENKGLEKIIDSIGDSLVAVNHKGELKTLNKKAKLILGYDEKTKSYGNKTIDEFMFFTEEKGKIFLMKKVPKKNRSVSLRGVKLLSNNSSYEFYTTIYPITDQLGANFGYIFLFQDVTATQKLEDQRAEFNAIASHELRTPIAIMEGFLFSLTNDKSLKYDEKTREYINEIASATQGLSNLTRDILTIVKAEKHQIKIKLEKTNLNKLVSSVIKNYEQKAAQRNLVIEFKPSVDLPEVLTDGGKIIEVLENLIDNAIKFSENNKIIISCQENKKKEVEFKIKDFGIGINKNETEKIFNKFYRTEDWKTRTTGGVGLGLYITHSYIKSLGGQIGVESRLNEGSTFWFTLPITIKKDLHKKSEKQLNELIRKI